MYVVVKRLDGSRCHLVRRWASVQATLLDGDIAPLKRGTAPTFRSIDIVAKRLDKRRCHLVRRLASAHAHCIRWGPAPPKGHSLSIFGLCLLWPNGWMDQDATWYGGRPRLRRHCFKCGTQLSRKKGAQPPVFGPCLLWPNGWMNQDATWYEDRPRPRPHCVRWGHGYPT